MWFDTFGTAIWLLPHRNAYGGWPASGEIDIVESRGKVNSTKIRNGITFVFGNIIYLIAYHIVFLTLRIIFVNLEKTYQEFEKIQLTVSYGSIGLILQKIVSEELTSSNAYMYYMNTKMILLFSDSVFSR